MYYGISITYAFCMNPHGLHKYCTILIYKFSSIHVNNNCRREN